MRPIIPLTTAGLAVALLAGCASPTISDYPVEPPPMSARERDQVRELVTDFSQTEVEPSELPKVGEFDALDAAERQRLREAREPFDYGSGDDSLEEYERGPRGQEESRSESEYSRGEINAIKRRVNRRYESEHDRRHELKAKYGL